MNFAVHNIGTVTRNNWILETRFGVIAVDTGLPGQSDGFLRRFRKKWRQDDMKYVFLTHAHNDHAGFVAELLTKTKAQIVMSRASQEVLSAGKPSETHEYKNWMGKILEKMMASPMGSYPAVTDMGRLRIVSEGDPVFEDMGLAARVIELPGHTSDSIGLHLTDENIIFCGDAAMNRVPLNANRHTVLIENVKAFQASWDKLTALGPKLLYPGHGKAFPIDDLKKYRNFL